MALTINTNIMSLNAQRNLNTSQTKLSSAIERLSSGNRINSAKDDAAGLAISTRMTTQINGLNRAVQNANDGISLSQTTESALDEVTNNMQRIRELAVQSTNASNSPSDRAALDAEVQQRLSEVTRIATQTNFNGMKVLDGSAQNLSFQVGANVGEVINVSLNTGMKANQVGELATSTIAAADIATTLGTGGAATTLAAGDFKIQVGTGTAFDITGDIKTTQDLADAINSKSGQGVTAYVAENGDLKISSAQALTFTGTATAATAAAGKFQTANATVSTTSTLADASVATVDGANDTINRIDAALQSVSALRSTLGAVQNRFESTISNLQNISQNLTSSKSAITDADFAQETANMSSAQILQQAGVSVLAQANQSQQIVTKLLQ
jgi:flagellin